jgi:hypothetical protein
MRKLKLACAALTVTSATTGAVLYGGCSSTVEHNPPVNPLGSGPTAPDAAIVPPDTGSTSALNLRIATVESNGTPARTFAAKGDVFLEVVPVDTTQAVAAGDYAFHVTDTGGKLLSSDALSCRQLNVDAQGNVTVIASGGSTSCEHATQTVTDTSGHSIVIVQLAPFDSTTPNATGAMTFVVELAPAPTSDNFGADALTATFAILEGQGSGTGSGTGSGSGSGSCSSK